MSTHGVASWSTQQLTELLALVSALPEGADVVQLALEHTAESLEGDVGAVVANGSVVASIGYAAGAVPDLELLAAAAGEIDVLDVPGAGLCDVLVVDCDGLVGGRLLVGRLEGGFTSEDRSVFRGFARVLSLALGARRALQHERDQRLASEELAAHHERLVASSSERQALLERLARIQRSISTRRPLNEVLDAIVCGANELIGDGFSALRLVDPDDPTMLIIAATHGISPEVQERGHRSPLGGGVGGRAITQRELVLVHDYQNSDAALPVFLADGVQASMAAPVFQNDDVVGSLSVGSRRPGRRYSESEQEVLRAFAEHVSLALNDARTVAALQEAVSVATRQARHDALTGLPNRTHLLEELTKARASSASIGLLFIDLDDFKLVNDTLGHPVGDALLRVVGERISGSVRAGDVVARLGGDEFAVLLTAGSATKAEQMAERIGQALSLPFHLPGHDVSIGASTGVVLCGGPSTETAEELLRDADVAMYRAKALGKRRAVLFAPSMRVDLQARSRLERDLRHAIDRHELVVYYQPIVDISSAGAGEIVGTEALLRWFHPERGLIPPNEFIPVAEDTGMILAIGRQALLDATAQTASWNCGRSQPLSVSVNVSAQQLAERTIVADVHDALARSGLPASLLTLELTETVLVQDIENAVGLLGELKTIGVRLAIDDFGTGYSSLSYLAQLPVDVLKVDKAFVAGIRRAVSDMRLAASIVAIAATLELETVVEGVETQEQLEAMRALGCTRFQGFLWSAAMRAENFEQLLDGGRGSGVPLPRSMADERVRA